ncbi:hypothetical protein AUK57_04095 [Candidatus Saccharibacteria bacterium CG2_30_41_52]|nr:MAG: hypothetical protein AUK57_04095 [Candidatus Saccharibacteria bacterium CG2_30_41_52]
MTNTSTPKLAVIVLNWNGIKDTIPCLDSLIKQSIPVKIIVVDNGSTDNSIKILSEYQSKHANRVDVLYNPINYGFAGGVNTGIEYALNDNYGYIALFNNDAMADKEWASGLIDSISENKSIGIATCLLLNSLGEKIDSTGEQYSTWGLPFPRNRNHKRELAPADELVFGATGGASLYKTEMLREIGLFDEDFFAYYEDTDVSFRAQLAGWKVAYTDKAIAYHKQGETSKRMPGFTVYQTFKNLPLLFIKNVPCGLLLSIGIRFYFAYALMFFNAIVKGSGKSAIKGAWQGFILGFKKLGERREIQSNKKVTTKYIKSMLWPDLPPDQTGIRKLRKFFTAKN